MVDRPPRLVWKFEDCPEDAQEEDLRDVGPAWLDTFGHDSIVPAHSEKLNEGKWITREEARRIAKEQGFELVEDG